MTIVVGNLDHDSLQHIGIPCTDDEMTEDAAILWARSNVGPVQSRVALEATQHDVRFVVHPENAPPPPCCARLCSMLALMVVDGVAKMAIAPPRAPSCF